MIFLERHHTYLHAAGSYTYCQARWSKWKPLVHDGVMAMAKLLNSFTSCPFYTSKVQKRHQKSRRRQSLISSPSGKASHCTGQHIGQLVLVTSSTLVDSLPPRQRPKLRTS